MTLTTHALAGAVIGEKVDNPWLVILLALIFHFILDSLRHGEYFDSRTATIKDTYWKVALDLSIGGNIILFFLFYSQPDFHTTRNILLGSFFSIFPDFTTLLYWKFHWKVLKKIKQFHSFAHRYSRYPKFSPEREWNFRNVRNDILISILAIVILFLNL